VCVCARAGGWVGGVLLTYNLAFIKLCFLGYLHVVVGVDVEREASEHKISITLYKSYQKSYPLQTENQTSEVELGDDVI
jgi:hypothetical protein